MSEEEKDYDFIVGFTIFGKTSYKTMYRHFNKLDNAILFASNNNLKNNSKIYVDYDLYKQEKEKNEKGIKALEILRQYFSEDLQPDFIYILEILRDEIK